MGLPAAVEDLLNWEIGADGRIRTTAARDETFTLPDIARSTTSLVLPEVRDFRIVGLDQQAGSGTHAASSRQVGHIQVVRAENKGKRLSPPAHRVATKTPV